MKLTVVIPTYWGRPTPEVWKEGDAIYAHPIPLNSDAKALIKTIESFNAVNNHDFNLVIVASATAREIEKKMEKKLKEILNSVNVKFPLYFVSHSHIDNILSSCTSMNSECKSFISLTGYSNIKNSTLMLAEIMDSDVVTFIDDDEYITDPEFIDKVLKYIGNEHVGKHVYGVSGYYVYNNGSYKLKEDIVPWMTYWNRVKWMNKTFEGVIGSEPRLKETPFVFGGCMVLHKHLFRKIPFDPRLNRGEEFDYLLNAQMFGYSFYLDNQLHVRHEPPPVSYPAWMHMREDIYTFVYLQSKLRSQQDRPNMRRLYAEDFDPYPGFFLQKRLLDYVYKTNIMLSNSYLIEGDTNSAGECLRNIYLAETEAVPKSNPFLALINNQVNWENLMKKVGEHKENLFQFVEKIK